MRLAQCVACLLTAISAPALAEGDGARTDSAATQGIGQLPPVLNDAEKTAYLGVFADLKAGLWTEAAAKIDAPDAGELMGGETGALFDKMLAAIGRDRSSIWLAPFATIRPVGRVPQDALRRLTAIARHQISLVAPKRLLIMGDTPSRALLGTEVIPARGEFHSLNLGPPTVEAVATYHPRLLLERPACKAQAWKDLQLLMKGL